MTSVEKLHDQLEELLRNWRGVFSARYPETIKLPIPGWLDAQGTRVDSIPYLEPQRGSPEGSDAEPSLAGRGPIWDGEGHDGNFLGAPPKEDVLDSPRGRDVRESGSEALAYYIPYHVLPQKWGIYYRETGLVFLSEFLLYHGVPGRDALRAAFRVLEAHEEFHAIEESLVTVYELAGRKPLYLVSDRRKWPSPIPPGLDLGQVEEALANSDAVRKLKRYGAAINHFMSLQPPGYRDWEYFRWLEGFTGGVEIHLTELARSGGLGGAPAGPILPWARQTRAEVPRYLVRDAQPGAGVIFPFRSHGLEVQVHFANEHTPTHFHLRNPAIGGVDRAYTYPDYRPARTKDPPMTRSEKKLVSEVIRRYPEAQFVQELRRQAEWVRAKKRL